MTCILWVIWASFSVGVVIGTVSALGVIGMSTLMDKVINLIKGDV